MCHFNIKVTIKITVVILTSLEQSHFVIKNTSELHLVFEYHLGKLFQHQNYIKIAMVNLISF